MVIPPSRHERLISIGSDTLRHRTIAGTDAQLVALWVDTEHWRYAAELRVHLKFTYGAFVGRCRQSPFVGESGVSSPSFRIVTFLQYHATSLSTRLAIDRAGATACASFSDMLAMTISDSR